MLKKEIRFAELLTLIKSQVLDDQSTSQAEVLEEVEMIAVSQRAHIEIHRRRRLLERT
ncbi:MAG: hypothetical protein IPM82_25980 [Saprospiraceae bacterium]|nr:hypothetical protein [Saprospiraceae bacterium]